MNIGFPVLVTIIYILTTNSFSIDFPQMEAVFIKVLCEKQGILHNHTPKKVGMYSFQDVFTLRNLYELTYGTRKPETFSLLVCKNAFGVLKYYNLKIDDFEAFNNYVNNMMSNNNQNGSLEEKETIDRIHDQQEKLYFEENFQNYEKSFLKQFKDFGISLYSATDENVTDWKKLQLTANGLDVESVPCN